MVLDGTAMVPQVFLVATTPPNQHSPDANHFVGLLCLGRLFRTFFWVWLVLHPDSGHAVWTFVVPDLLHTIVMGDYLYHWLAKVRKEKILPLVYNMQAKVSV